MWWINMNKILILIIVGIILVMGIFVIKGLSATGEVINEKGDGSNRVVLQVNIPCPGHAPLIIQELNKIDGVENVKFLFPNKFEVTYNKISKQNILSASIFQEFPAKEI